MEETSLERLLQAAKSIIEDAQPFSEDETMDSSWLQSHMSITNDQWVRLQEAILTADPSYVPVFSRRNPDAH